MSENLRRRAVYALLFLVLTLVEVLIALFVRDRFIRPYFGDVLVTVLLCCFGRILFPKKLSALPLLVFLFASAVEVLQYFDYVSLLGLQDNGFFRTLLGTTFSFSDLICYGAGCLLFYLGERFLLLPTLDNRRKK